MNAFTGCSAAKKNRRIDPAVSGFGALIQLRACLSCAGARENQKVPK
jgi:hypothetical protein